MKLHSLILITLAITGAAHNAPGQTVKPEVFGPGIISGPVNDAAPAFMPDGKTVYFHRSSSTLGVILVSHWKNGRWSEPEIAPFSGRWSDIEPAIAPDGSYMIFASNRPATPDGKALNGCWNGQHYSQGGGNLWRVDRKGDGWGEPHRLPDLINSDSSIFSPALTADGSLYFMKPVADTGKFHIFRANNRNGQFESPVPVPFSAADTISDVDCTVDPDESFMIFSSRRPPAKKMELFYVTRVNGKWGEPVDMGEDLIPSYCNEARLSPDHRILYFSSGYVPSRIYPSDSAATKEALINSEWETGASNIWFIPLDRWLKNH
jgi:hypothetical protein